MCLILDDTKMKHGKAVFADSSRFSRNRSTKGEKKNLIQAAPKTTRRIKKNSNIVKAKPQSLPATAATPKKAY